MHSIRTLLLSTLCLLGPAGSLQANELRTAPTVLDFVGLWLESEYAIGRPSSFPDIIAVPAQQLVVRRYGEGSTVDPSEIVALYDHQVGAILVSETWTGQSASELSVLVHEMVHHMQHEAGTIFACPAEREKMAYEAQNEFLALFGLNLQSAFGIEPTLILVATACVH